MVAEMVKNLPAMQDTQVQSLGLKDPLEKEMATHSFPYSHGEFHGQMTLAGYSLWCNKDTEWITYQVRSRADPTLFVLHSDEILKQTDLKPSNTIIQLK